MKKLAVIRNDESSICPFGLSIPFACKVVGEKINDMTAINKLSSDATKEDIEKIVNSNLTIFKKIKNPAKCSYLVKLFPTKEKSVDCNYGDSAAGLQEAIPFIGSPFFAKVFSPDFINGVLSYPPSSEYDLGTNRNEFYGMYDFASRTERIIIRKAILEYFNINLKRI